MGILFDIIQQQQITGDQAIGRNVVDALSEDLSSHAGRAPGWERLIVGDRLSRKKQATAAERKPIDNN